MRLRRRGDNDNPVKGIDNRLAPLTRYNWYQIGGRPPKDVRFVTNFLKPTLAGSRKKSAWTTGGRACQR
jgi:hypothetical protein